MKGGSKLTSSTPLGPVDIVDQPARLVMNTTQTPETVRQSVQPGELLAGKYRVDRVLGEGGMGIVVAATNEALRQKVAIKLLRPGALDNAEALGRFKREAQAAASLKSQHVARVLDVGALDD